MIYWYGLMAPEATDPEASLAALDGVTGAVRVLSLPQGHLVYGDHDGATIMAKRRFLLAHTRVLEAASNYATVLPMRFGMVAEDIAEVATLLQDQAELVSAQFSKLAGGVEYGVRLSFPSGPALAHELERHPDLVAERDRLARAGGHFEKAEFGQKLGAALERHRTDLQREVVASLRAHVTDLVLRAPESEYQILNAFVLLQTDQEAALGDVLADIAGDLDFAPGSEPKIELVGPAPLYNFVRLNLATPQREVA